MCLIAALINIHAAWWSLRARRRLVRKFDERKMALHRDLAEIDMAAKRVLAMHERALNTLARTNELNRELIADNDRLRAMLGAKPRAGGLSS